MPVYKRYTAFRIKNDSQYYKRGDSVLNRLGIALNRIVAMMYMIDILYYTIIYNIWGIGE